MDIVGKFYDKCCRYLYNKTTIRFKTSMLMGVLDYKIDQISKKCDN